MRRETVLGALYSNLIGPERSFDLYPPSNSRFSEMPFRPRHGPGPCSRTVKHNPKREQQAAAKRARKTNRRQHP